MVSINLKRKTRKKYDKKHELGWGIAQLVSRQAGDVNSNPGGDLTQLTQYMNEKGRDYQM